MFEAGLNLFQVTVANAVFAGGVLLFETPTSMLAELPGSVEQVVRDSVTFGWHQTSIRLLAIGSFFQSTLLFWGFLGLAIQPERIVWLLIDSSIGLALTQL
jgi:hypothetical protein